MDIKSLVVLNLISDPVILDVMLLESNTKCMVTTAQILADRALQASCDEQCVDWAIGLLETGHETAATCRLVAKLRPHNHFELASLRDQILVELGVDATSDNDAIIMYSAELLGRANDGTMDLDTAIAEVKDMYVSNDLDPSEIYDFYLLYFARADFKEQEFQYYWPDADRSNIEQITRDRIRQFIDEHQVAG